MKQTDVLILGGLSGITAGMSCRKFYPDKKVTLIRKEDTVLIPCGIPYIFGTVGAPKNNVIPDGLLEKNGIELIRNEVVSVDRSKKTVTLKDGEVITYEKLIFATGSVPAVAPIPGIDKKMVFTVRKDFNYLEGMLEELKSVKDLVIIGGGFIGVEFADECRKDHEMKITLIEALPHCLQMAMDDEFCQEAEAKLAETGIKILKGSQVKSFQGDDSVKSVKLTDNTEIKADMVILAIGAKPNTELAKKAGLELGYQGAIKTDRYMQSYNDPDVYACGDCAEKHSFFSGKALPAMLASVATSEARIAGSNLYSPTHQNFGTISVFSTYINGRAFAVAGLTERQARECKMNVMIGTAEAPDTHPGGMPNSSLTKVKLVFAKGTGILLGGSISGGRPVGEMINVISACIMHQMTANDIYQFQMGTHPALTSSPIMYPIVNAAGMVLSQA